MTQGNQERHKETKKTQGNQEDAGKPRRYKETKKR